jgi:PST family polysaccharide transporter
MKLIKTTIYTSSSQVITILSGIITVKVVASKIGPEGVSLVGQFQNISTIMVLIATLAIGQGVIKYLAEYSYNKNKQHLVIKTGLWMVIISSLLIAAILLFCSKALSIYSFKRADYSSVYVLFSIFLPLVSFNAFANCVLNGLKYISYFTLVNITASIINLIITIILANKLGVYGVLISTNFVNLFLLFFNLFIFNKYSPFSFSSLKFGLDKPILIALLKFSSMGFLAGFGLPFCQLLIRNKLISIFGIEMAGQWQAVSRISDFYLGFVLSVLGVYYLPRFSEIINKNTLKAEVVNAYKYLIPVVSIMALGIWLMRYFIIKTLLTEKFLPSGELFGFQMLGDVFKVMAWLLSSLLWAKAMTKTYLILDSIFFILYIVITYSCISLFGFKGVAIGFFAEYLLYWLVLLIIFSRYLGVSKIYK